jgi:hypothetical protein
MKGDFLDFDDFSYVVKRPVDSKGRVKPMVYALKNGKIQRKLNLNEVRDAMKCDEMLGADEDLIAYIARRDASAEAKTVVNQYSKKDEGLKGEELYNYLDTLYRKNMNISGGREFGESVSVSVGKGRVSILR